MVFATFNYKSINRKKQYLWKRIAPFGEKPLEKLLNSNKKFYLTTFLCSTKKIKNLNLWQICNIYDTFVYSVTALKYSRSK